MINLLLIKFYNNYAIIHIQHISKPSYIKYYNIIHASYVKLTSYLDRVNLNNFFIIYTTNNKIPLFGFYHFKYQNIITQIIKVS